MSRPRDRPAGPPRPDEATIRRWVGEVEAAFTKKVYITHHSEDAAHFVPALRELLRVSVAECYWLHRTLLTEGRLSDKHREALIRHFVRDAA